MEIVLGTAQFGLNYGITNSSGIVLADEVKAILNYAASEGISKLDTAQAYGESEAVIGGYPFFDVMTKISGKNFATSTVKITEIRKNIEESLFRLKRSSVYSVMIHDVESINFGHTKHCLKLLEQLKDDGIIRKIGVSLYTPEKLLEIMSHFSIDVVQVPINIFDQRFCSKKIKSEISKHGIDLYARSIFLQGSLLVSKTPKNLIKWDDSFKSYRQFCMERNLSQIGCCVNFLKSLEFVKGLVVGITKKSELKEIIDEFRFPKPKIDFSHLASTENKLINPSLW